MSHRRQFLAHLVGIPALQLQDGSALERGYSDQVRKELAAMGHEVAVPNVPLGGAQCILVTESGDLVGGSDPRKDGIALGY